MSSGMNMSNDEIAVLIVSAVIAIIGAAKWMRRPVPKLQRRQQVHSNLLFIWPAFMAVCLFTILRFFAAHDVRNAAPYLGMYTALGLAWLTLGMGAVGWLGLSARLDAAERQNQAAAPALIGAMTGIMLSYAGGNFGDGPGWWVVVFSSGLAGLAMLLVWIVLGSTTAILDQITINRDPSAGCRAGAFLTSAGAVAGRGAAGNWLSAGETVNDFLQIAWPLIILLVLAILVERLFSRKDPQEEEVLDIAGVLPAILYLAGAGAYIYLLGWWT